MKLARPLAAATLSVIHRKEALGSPGQGSPFLSPGSAGHGLVSLGLLPCQPRERPGYCHVVFWMGQFSPRSVVGVLRLQVTVRRL